MNAPINTPKRQWSDCPKCGEPRGEIQQCRNGCDTWTAHDVGTRRGWGWFANFYTTRGGPRGQLSDREG